MPEKLKHKPDETREIDQPSIEEQMKEFRALEQTRVADISELASKFDEVELGNQYIRENKSVAEFQKVILDKVSEKDQSDNGSEGLRGAAAPLPSGVRSPEIGMHDTEVKRYSFLRALRLLASPQDKKARNDAAFELECSRAAEEQYGKSAQGILVPFDVLTRAITTSTAGAPAGATGGFTVATDLLASSFVDMLRNRSFVLRISRMLMGLVGNVDIPTKETYTIRFYA